MNLFEKNWISSRFVDFELKKYTLLGYLQKVENKFTQSKVYPYLSILKAARAELTALIQNVEMINLRQQKMLENQHQELIFKVSEIDTLIQISNYAVPKLENSIDSGNTIEQFVLSNIDFRPVGILPVQKNEGYLIIRNDGLSRVYRYQLRNVTPSSDNETYSTQLKTWFVQGPAIDKYRNTEDIKYNLIKTHRDLPNPATYSLQSQLSLPFTETLVPIGRKLLFQVLQA
jgi:hypothetical protein